MQKAQSCHDLAYERLSLASSQDARARTTKVRARRCKSLGGELGRRKPELDERKPHESSPNEMLRARPTEVGARPTEVRARLTESSHQGARWNELCAQRAKWHSLPLRSTRGQWREARYEEAQAWERNRVDRDLAEFAIQLPWETQAHSDPAHCITDEMIDVSMGRSRRLQGPAADSMQWFGVQQKAFDCILRRLVERQHGARAPRRCRSLLEMGRC